MASVLVVQAEAVPPGTMRAARAGGRDLAVLNVDGTLYVIENQCPHAGAPLAQGSLEGCVLTCPSHGSQFDVCAGTVRRGPATVPMARFPVRIEDGWVFADL